MKKITFTLLISLISIFTAQAQWVTDTAVNTLVSNSSPTGTQSIGTNTGGTYTVFWKQVNTGANFELRAQYINELGVQQFGPDGILISNTIPMGTYTVQWSVAVDSANNLYVGVTGTGSGTPGFVYKVNTDGELGWSSPISLGVGYVPVILPLSNGDIAVSYWGGTKGKLQRYNSDGVAVWENPVDINPSETYSNKATIGANIFELSNGDIIVVFHTKLSFGVNSLLFAHKYNSEGVQQWTAPAQLADMQTAYNSIYSGVTDGTSVYYGYSLSHDNRFDSYVQKVNADGTTPWGINGMDFDTNQTSFEKDVKIAIEKSSQFVWAISMYTTSAQDLHGEYIQKFDKVTGARQFTDNAHEIFAIDANSRVAAGNLQLISDMPVFVMKYGFDNGATPVTLHGVFLDSNGDFLLEEETIPVATFAASKGSVSFSRPVNGQGVVVFAEEKVTDDLKIYAQNFTIPIDCDIVPESIEDFTSACKVNLEDLTPPVQLDECGNEVTPTTDETVFPIVTTTTITWTYTTTSGLTAEQTQNIVIDDTTAPELSVQNISIEIDEESNAVITGELIDNGTTECTAIASWTITPNTFTCSDLGEQTVTVTATDANGNTSEATTLTITVTDPNNYCTTAGIEDYDKVIAVAYPNPAKDNLTIQAPYTIKSVTIYDMLGKTLLSNKNINSENALINISALSNGVYNVSVETIDNKNQKIKVIKN